MGTIKQLKIIRTILIANAVIIIFIYYYISVIKVDTDADIYTPEEKTIVANYNTKIQNRSNTIVLNQCTNLKEDLHEKLKKYLQVQDKDQPFTEVVKLLEEHEFKRSLIPQDHSAEYKYRIYRNVEKKEVYLLQWSEFKDSNSNKVYKSLNDIKHYNDNPTATYEDYLSF